MWLPNSIDEKLHHQRGFFLATPRICKNKTPIFTLVSILFLISEFLQYNMDPTDQPNSMCHIKSIHMYPLPPMDVTSVPFCLLTGEAVLHSGTSVDGPILLTNYRLYLQARETHYHIPIGLMETVENKELFYLNIGCKDARTYK